MGFNEYKNEIPTKNDEDYRVVAGTGFEPVAFGLWAQRATSAPPRNIFFVEKERSCWVCKIISNKRAVQV